MSEEENSKYESNNIKIAVTAVLSILLGAAFILALVYFGMNVQQNIDSKTDERKSEEKIVSIMSVGYETSEFGYVAANGGGGTMTKEEYNALPENILISSLRDGYDENYLVIDNQDLLNRALDKLRSSAHDESISYSVENGFFDSGSVILITRELHGLSDFKVKSVTRDEEYNIQIDTTEKTGEPTVADASEGRAIFVKVRNIQPKSVKVNNEAEKQEN